MNPSVLLERILGPTGAKTRAAMQAGLQFLDSLDTPRLLEHVGRTIHRIPRCTPIAKSALPDSYGGNQTGPSDDFLVGRGLFYLTEQRRLFLDCTSGHYQMLWGYNHPDLCAAIRAATRAGVTWDNHSNIPQAPLKLLSQRLVALANPPGEPDPLDTVLLGVCTGSVACAAALKIQLKFFQQTHGLQVKPAIFVLDGNYHGTDLVQQFMRGMWPHLVRPFEVVSLKPNDIEGLEKAFRKFGSRVAGFWAEPIMMNCEALAIDPAYLEAAHQWCRKGGALMCLDEIQTGFWQPDIFEFRSLGLRPDLVVIGKGMTAGFHPLSGVLLRRRYDVLEQYDAISTNGSAALPAFVALCSIELIQQRAEGIRLAAKRIHAGLESLAGEFRGQLHAAQGRGHLSGLKFKRLDAAKDFHRRLLQAGLWTRLHGYHEGHKTILTKLGLLADETVVDFVLSRFRDLLSGRTRPTKG
jgi:acetylornithine/succinyldiaminopimelate/putrescine aminotransferase